MANGHIFNVKFYLSSPAATYLSTLSLLTSSLKNNKPNDASTVAIAIGMKTVVLALWICNP